MKLSPTNKRAASSSQGESGGNVIKIYRRTVDPFTRMPNAALEDNRLSWRAKGILAYLLGRPPGWTTRMSDVIKRSKEGRDAVKAAMRELRETGYAELRSKIVNGKVLGSEWAVTDVSISRETDSQAVGFSGGGEISLLNKNNSNKKDSNKKKIHTSSNEDVEVFSENIINIYNETLPPMNIGFLPVNKLSDELEKALGKSRWTTEDDDSIKRFFLEVAAEKRAGDSRSRTLVRILWENY